MSNPTHKPRLRGGDPYRTTTKFQRSVDGKLLRDADGYLVPVPHERDAVPKRSTTPEERAAARSRAAEKTTEERKAMAKQSRRIRKRQSIGDPDCPLSRDEDFPLLAVLRRDRRDDLIGVVMEYRRLVALCEAEALKGQTYGGADNVGVGVEYVSRRMTGVEDVDSAAARGFKEASVPGGEVVYEAKVRRSRGAYDIPAVRKKAIDVDAYFEGEGGASKVGITEGLHIKVTEDVLLERIDRSPTLERIRSALGPLLDPFEDAVLGGQTLGWIGAQDGHVGRTAEIAGKTLVLRALAVVDGFLGSRKYKPANDNHLIKNKKAA